MSPDLKHATVFVMPLGGKDIEPVLRRSSATRSSCAARSPTRSRCKFAPDLRFRVDESFEQGAKIDAILNSPAVQRDLAVLGDDDRIGGSVTSTDDPSARTGEASRSGSTATPASR